MDKIFSALGAIGITGKWAEGLVALGIMGAAVLWTMFWGFVIQALPWSWKKRSW